MKTRAELFAAAERREVPLSALIELTHACNLDCEQCYLELVPDRQIGALSTDEWKRILRELADEGCLYLTISGGEPLARRDFFELASYARGLGFALRIFTNGTLCDDEAADRIAALAPLGVEISLHAARADVHDAITRRAGSFDKAVAAVRRLRARGIPVRLKCVLMARNLGEREPLRALAAALSAEVFFDAEVTPKNDGSTTPVALAARGDELVAIAADTVRGRSPRDRAAMLAAAPCAAGRRICHIGPTGDVHPCTQWTKPVGNLRRRSLREIWRGDDLVRLRHMRIGDLGGCRDCELLTVCSPCMALSLLERGDLAGPSPTKCRTAAARARALGIPGRPNGPTEPIAPVVQIRLKERRAPKEIGT